VEEKVRKAIVFVFGLLLGAAVVLLLHPRPAKAASSNFVYISRFADASSFGTNYSTVIFGDVKSISCVVEDGSPQRSRLEPKSDMKPAAIPAAKTSKTACYVLSQ
jgi:hypothetical protein